jgi:hypothetical protein
MVTSGLFISSMRRIFAADDGCWKLSVNGRKGIPGGK